MEAQFADEVAHAGFHITALSDEAVDGAHLDAQQQYINDRKQHQSVGHMLGNEIVDGIGVHHGQRHVDHGGHSHHEHNAPKILVKGFGNFEQFDPQGRVKPFGIVFLLKGLHQPVTSSALACLSSSSRAF